MKGTPFSTCFQASAAYLYLLVTAYKSQIFDSYTTWIISIVVKIIIWLLQAMLSNWEVTINLVWIRNTVVDIPELPRISAT